MRMGDLMKNLMINLPDFMVTKQGEQPEGRIKDEILVQILRRIKRGVDLIKEETNYTVNIQTDDELLCRFRSSECRNSHEGDCRESDCSYFVAIDKGIGKCTCSDGPLLCKHLHGVVLLSGKCALCSLLGEIFYIHLFGNDTRSQHQFECPRCDWLPL
jgi:hypothetical protein